MALLWWVLTGVHKLCKYLGSLWDSRFLVTQYRNVNSLSTFQRKCLSDFLHDNFETDPNFAGLLSLCKYVWTVHHKNKLVACVWMSVSRGIWGSVEGRVFAVCTHKRFRQKGLCKLVMQQMFRDAKMHDIDVLDLSVCRTHENMRGWRVRMYEKLGFQVYYTGNQPEPFYQMARPVIPWY